MTLRTLRLAALASALVMAGVTVPALSQSTPPTTTPTMSDVPMESMKIDTPTFLRMATSSNQFEILSSRLAEQQAQDEQVKAFARQMIADHTSAGEKMRTAVQEAGLEMASVPQSEADLEVRHKEMMDTLASASGNFDQAYVRAQYQAHEEAVRMFEAYAQNGDQSAIKAFAAETLPILQQHLAHVQELPGAPTSPATGSTGGARTEGGSMGAEGDPSIENFESGTGSPAPSAPQ
ncbi:DUF4142 domain-containing protein [Chthonobacter rhizosphaerae]|uniref:DUF4142 domain-containing protein n=1 Tax=Chthonobacter rhizosphaerae TaxID=2735553 RepID=UPI0015EEB01D|nr:DUF4142 domain-containing protein [Chthonobacter rhizosphaerae]